QSVDLIEIEENLANRDEVDSSRIESPLMKMPDAEEVDTSDLTLEEQVSKIIQLAKAKI
ncbi:MAG: cytidylate kinase, partial [Algoriphagus sp.]